MSSSAISKAASRYSSFDSQSSASSSIDLNLKPSSNPKLKTLRSNSPATSIPIETSDAIVKVNDNAKVRNEHNFSSLVKKFMEKRSTSKSNRDRQLPLIIPADFIAEDLKKTARKGSNLAALPKKLFGKGGGSSENKAKALMEVKSNTRTLAMVLRSERELLSSNKEQESRIAELTSLLDERNGEVEKLKDLCLKQREEIKALKSAILFPDEMSSQLQVLLEKQGSDLKQAKQVIPTLQRQISSLTGQLQSLSEDLAEVKAVKYTGRPSYDGSFSSPTAPVYNQEDSANSLDFSSDDPATTPDSVEIMLLNDMNPCLTPYYSKTKSKEYEALSYDYADDDKAYKVDLNRRKSSRSSGRLTFSRAGSSTTRACAPFCRSDGSTYKYGRQKDQVL